MRTKIRNLTQNLYQLYGIDLSPFDEGFLEKAIFKRSSNQSYVFVEDFISKLEGSEDEAHRLFNSLHISYSEFFRDPITFSYLEKMIIPLVFEQSIKNKNREVRMWSAAGASGQEAYSLAMLAEEHKKTAQIKYELQDFSTDRNTHLILKSIHERYDQKEIGNISANRLSTFFNRNGNDYYIKDFLRSNIHFSEFNIVTADESYPTESITGGFNIVLCCNILFYYNETNRHIIIEKLRRSLAKDGFLVTGEAERDYLITAGFKELYKYSSIFIKNKS